MDELKFFVLNKILENEDRNLDSSELFMIMQHKIGWSEYNTFISEFLKNNLVDEYSANKLTELGKNRLNELKIKINQKEKDEKAERIKLYNESVMSGWKRKTFWYIFALGIFGGVYSGIDLFGKITSSKEVPKEQLTKQKMEEELSKLRTLILTTKKKDTLN